MSGNQVGACWHCGQTLSDTDIGREAECPACGKPVHVCRNCRFFAPGRPNDCEEPIADPVRDKTRANFCGYFTPHVAAHRGQPTQDTDVLRQAAEDLFRK